MDNSPSYKAISAIIAVAAVALVGLTLYTAFFGVFPDGIQRSAHLLLVIILVFAMALRATFDPEAPKSNGPNVVLKRLWISFVLIFAAIATGHHFFNFDAINNRYGSITQYEIIFGILLVVALFDACRRTIGWPIIILASIFILYGLFGAYLPEALAHRGYSLKRVAAQLYLGGGGIFGTPLGVSATFVTGVAGSFARKNWRWPSADGFRYGHDRSDAWRTCEGGSRRVKLDGHDFWHGSGQRADNRANLDPVDAEKRLSQRSSWRD